MSDAGRHSATERNADAERRYLELVDRHRRSIEAIQAFSWTVSPAGAGAWFERLPYPFRLPGAGSDRSAGA